MHLFGVLSPARRSGSMPGGPRSVPVLRPSRPEAGEYAKWPPQLGATSSEQKGPAPPSLGPPRPWQFPYPVIGPVWQPWLSPSTASFSVHVASRLAGAAAPSPPASRSLPPLRRPSRHRLRPPSRQAFPNLLPWPRAGRTAQTRRITARLSQRSYETTIEDGVAMKLCMTGVEGLPTGLSRMVYFPHTTSLRLTHQTLRTPVLGRSARPFIGTRGQGGWRNRLNINVSGPDGAEIQHTRSALQANQTSPRTIPRKGWCCYPLLSTPGRPEHTSS